MAGAGEDEPPVHIGQSSLVRRFLFRSYPTLGITTADTWERFLECAETIFDENGNTLTATEITRIMRATTGLDGRPLKPRVHADDEHRYTTPDGHSFCRRPFF